MTKFDRTCLVAALSLKLDRLIDNCSSRGIKVVPYYGFRTLEEQAKLWRQSRKSSEINTELMKLSSTGAYYLCKVLQSVGPCSGPHATNAILGHSWHNWGEAADFYWEVDGQPNWNDGEGYEVLAEEAMNLGLTAGRNFKSFKDPGHVQLRSQEVPDVYTLLEVDAHFKKKYAA